MERKQHQERVSPSCYITLRPTFPSTFSFFFPCSLDRIPSDEHRHCGSHRCMDKTPRWCAAGNEHLLDHDPLGPGYHMGAVRSPDRHPDTPQLDSSAARTLWTCRLPPPARRWSEDRATRALTVPVEGNPSLAQTPTRHWYAHRLGDRSASPTPHSGGGWIDHERSLRDRLPWPAGRTNGIYLVRCFHALGELAREDRNHGLPVPRTREH